MFIKKIKNVCLFFGVLSVIGPIFSVETPTQNASPELNALNENSILDEINALEKIAEDIKEPTEKEQVSSYVKMVKSNFQNKPKLLDDSKDNICEFLDAYKNAIDIINNIFMNLNSNNNRFNSQEAKQIINSLSNLKDKIKNIKKEEAMQQISFEKLEKLKIIDFLHYCGFFETESTSNSLFLRAIKSDNPDYSEVLNDKDFAKIIIYLLSGISKAKNKKDKEDIYSKSLAFMEKLVKKSKISDKKNLLPVPDYIRYPEKYDEYIKKVLNQLDELNYYVNDKNIENFLKKIENDFAQNLKTASWLDYFYKLSTSKPLEVGENITYFAFRRLIAFFVGMLIFPIQFYYEGFTK